VMPWYVQLPLPVPRAKPVLRRIPPEDGHADVSFWYATYVIHPVSPHCQNCALTALVSLQILCCRHRHTLGGCCALDARFLAHHSRCCQLCALYYYVWMILRPKFGGYEIVEESLELDNGERTTRFVRKYKRDVSQERRPLLGPSESEL